MTDFEHGVGVGMLLAVKNSNNEIPSYMDDPDWAIWESLPEPDTYQAIYGVRIVDLSYTNAGNYYTEYEKTEGSTVYTPVESSAVSCHINFTGLLRNDLNPTYLAPYTIDWGDSTVSSHTGGVYDDVCVDVVGADGHGVGKNPLCHKYSETGLYIVTVTLDDKGYLYGPRIATSGNSDYFASINQPRVIFAKFGKGYLSNPFAPTGIFYALGCPRFVKFLQLPSDIPYELKSNWKQMTNGDHCLQFYDAKISLPTLPANIFYQNYALTEDGIDVEATTSVGNYAFRDCRSLEKLYLPNCTNIGDYAFYNCYSLKSIVAPNCTSIGRNAFYNCYSIHTLKVADDCTFGSNAFSNCYSLYPHPDGTL